MNLTPHTSSKTGEWETPQDLFDELDAVFNFDLDACASAKNAKCVTYFSKKDNALAQVWKGNVWMNPPYGRQIGAFMDKAYLSSLEGATGVCLVPARTDTRWWHRFAMRGRITFLRGRLTFGGAKKGAPFPSAIVIFWGNRLREGICAEAR